MKQESSIWHYFDFWLMGAVLLLTAYGILIIHSAISNTPGFVGYEYRQMLFMVVGIIILLGMASLDYRILTSAHWYIYAFLILLLLAVLVLGTAQNSANRWIPLGIIDLQPSELGRIFIPITLGQFLANKQRNIGKFTNTIISLAYMAPPLGLIFIQPDLGMTILFVVIWFGMMMIAGLPMRHFLILLSIAVLAGMIVYPNLADYQKSRVTVFLDPQSDPEKFNNIKNALISIGSGGWWGKGYFNGTQSQLGFLRVQHTDFIFSVLNEEMGFFFGALVVVTLIGFILLRILRVASLTPDPAGRYLCVGIATMLFFQTTVSVGMNLNLMPVTGLTLPFISYGGSALFSLYLGVGVVQSVLMRHRRQEFG